MKKIATVSYRNTRLDIVRGLYVKSKRPSLLAVDAATREPYAKISINVEDVELEENEVIVHHDCPVHLVTLLVAEGVLVPSERQVTYGLVQNGMVATIGDVSL